MIDLDKKTIETAKTSIKVIAFLFFMTCSVLFIIELWTIILFG